MRSIPRTRLEYFPILLALAGLFSAVFIALILLDAMQGRVGFASNFDSFYNAAKSWAGEVPAYCLACRPGMAGEYSPFLNPPMLLFLLWPLHFFSYTVALWLFTFALLGFWLAVLFSGAVKALLPTLAQNPRRYALAVLVLPLPFVMYNVNFGQLGLLYAGLMLLGAANLGARPGFAGVMFGLLALKPPLALMVPVLLLGGRHWRAVIFCGLTVLALVALATLCFGVQSWLDWLHVMQTHSNMVHPHHIPRGFRTQLLSLYGGLLIMDFGRITVYAAQAAASLAATLLLGWVAWRKPTAATTTLQVYFMASLVATPYVLAYDGVILVAVVLLWLERSLGEAPAFTAARTAKVTFMALLLIYPAFHSKLLPVFAPFPISAALLLGVALMVSRSAIMAHKRMR